MKENTGKSKYVMLGMCHSLCWMAPFMVIGEIVSDFLHIPRVRLKPKPQKNVLWG